MVPASLKPSLTRPVRLAFATAIAAAASLAAQTPSAADGFDPNVDGNVFALATQPDGRIVVGGQFSAFRTDTTREVLRNNLARLNPDGSVDESFALNADGPVRAILIQPDGKIVIGGDFTALTTVGSAASTVRNRIARLNADGSVDPGFDPNLGGGLLPQVHALVRQPDGSIVAGGSFTTAQPNGAAAPTTRNRIARFHADGTLDQGYDPNPNSLVMALALHVDGKIVVGGGFTRFQENNKPEPTTRNRIARLNPDGTLDSEFHPNANNGVTSLAIQRDGKIVLAGHFTTLQPINEELEATREHVARLNPDGSLDSEFYPKANGSVVAVAVQADGGILIGGSFNTVWARGAVSATRTFAARLNADGSLDAGFNPGVNATVAAFAVQPDGKLILGGYFTRAQPEGAPSAIIRNRLARLNPDGSLDGSFELHPGGRTLASVVQADGKIVIGGSFTTIGGATHNYLARLNPDGSVDPTYTPDLNGRVLAMAIQPDGKILIGGAFTTIGGETRNRFARLNPSGTIDSEFHPNVNGQVGAIALQPDGRIIIGGAFQTLFPIGATETISRANIARLTATGQVDTSFNPSPNSTVSAIAVQADGKILIGGAFTSLTPGGATSATRRNHIARLNADGTLDTTYDPTLQARVSSIVLQADGKAVVGGMFTAAFPPGSTEETVRNRIIRLNADGTVDASYDPNASGNVLTMALQPDDKLVVGGTFTFFQPNGGDAIHRNYVARLNADGTLDPAFNLYLDETAGNRVDSVLLQPNGGILISGNFRSLQPAGSSSRVLRESLARINANGTLDTAFDASVGGATRGEIHALAIQSDDRVIVAGSFADLGGARSTNIARFRPEGTADPAFGANLTSDGPIHAVVVLPDSAPVASQLGGFAWLNADGSLHAGFTPTGSARISGEVRTVAVQADGKVLLGGAFADLSNTTAGNLARFHANGELDSSFTTTVNGAVSGILVQPDGQIVIVGAFTLVNNIVRNRIARLSPSGVVDPAFDPGASAAINTVVQQADGSYVVGGAFTSFSPNATTTPVLRNFLARITANGTIDENYNPNPNFAVQALALQDDGRLVIVGGFTTLQPSAAQAAVVRSAIARLNADGTVDADFYPTANGPLRTVLLQPDGKIVLGGTFTTLQPNGAEIATTRNNIARVNSDGTLDEGFDPNANGAVNTLAQLPGGGILLGGEFRRLQPNGAGTTAARNHVALLNSDGSLHSDFNPAINGVVATIVAQPDGTVLVGGNFTGLQPTGSIIVGGNFDTIGGVAARNLALLDDDGLVSSSYQPQPDGAVNALLVLPDGRAIAGGGFTTVAGAPRNRIARFGNDGTLDAGFNPNADGPVHALALQADGRVLVGGAFATLGGEPRSNLGRVNADGTLDATFLPATSGAVSALAVQPDGRILLIMAGSGVNSVLMRLNADGTPDATFPALNGGAEPINALALQSDGRIVVGGTFTSLGGVARARLARLNADGTLDPTFDPGANGAVTALALQADGRLMLGGDFTNVSGLPRVGLARLAATAPATQTLGATADRSTVIWSRAGTSGELAAVGFEQSSDLRTWTRLGFATRIGASGDWQLGGLSLPASGLFYVRARGVAMSSAGVASGIVESIREINFDSPVAGIATELGAPATRPVTPAQAAAPAFSFDPFTGIASRSALMVVPGEGTVEILVASHLPTKGPGSARLTNLSTRGRVTAESPLTLGFVIEGTDSRRVLLRAIGPALVGFGVNGALASTRLELHDTEGQLLAANEGWENSAGAAQAFAPAGAFPLTPGSADSAALITLTPGNYTVQVIDPSGRGGIGLAEIYDAESGTGSRLVNVSSLGTAGSGDDALISGFVVAGDTSRRVLLRGIGPGLTQFGASPVLTDPALLLFDSAGRALGSNDNWISSIAQVATAAASAGAFALEAGSRDAAVLATLPPGAYTMQVKAEDGQDGTALLEIYEVP